MIANGVTPKPKPAPIRVPRDPPLTAVASGPSGGILEALPPPRAHIAPSASEVSVSTSATMESAVTAQSTLSHDGISSAETSPEQVAETRLKNSPEAEAGVADVAGETEISKQGEPTNYASKSPDIPTAPPSAPPSAPPATISQSSSANSILPSPNVEEMISANAFIVPRPRPVSSMLLPAAPQHPPEPPAISDFRPPGPRASPPRSASSPAFPASPASPSSPASPASRASTTSPAQPKSKPKTRLKNIFRMKSHSPASPSSRASPASPASPARLKTHPPSSASTNSVASFCPAQEISEIGTPNIAHTDEAAFFQSPFSDSAVPALDSSIRQYRGAAVGHCTTPASPTAAPPSPDTPKQKSRSRFRLLPRKVPPSVAAASVAPPAPPAPPHREPRIEDSPPAPAEDGFSLHTVNSATSDTRFPAFLRDDSAPSPRVPLSGFPVVPSSVDTPPAPHAPHSSPSVPRRSRSSTNQKSILKNPLPTSEDETSDAEISQFAESFISFEDSTLDVSLDLGLDFSILDDPIGPVSSFAAPHSAGSAGSAVSASSAPLLSPNLIGKMPLNASSTSLAKENHSVMFSSKVLLYETWPVDVYDRKPETATCNQLTPLLAQEIKHELNMLKLEMAVHEDSRVYTHFF